MEVEFCRCVSYKLPKMSALTSSTTARQAFLSLSFGNPAPKWDSVYPLALQRKCSLLPQQKKNHYKMARVKIDLKYWKYLSYQYRLKNENSSFKEHLLCARHYAGILYIFWYSFLIITCEVGVIVIVVEYDVRC